MCVALFVVFLLFVVVAVAEARVTVEQNFILMCLVFVLLLELTNYFYYTMALLSLFLMHAAALLVTYYTTNIRVILSKSKLATRFLLIFVLSLPQPTAKLNRLL